MVNVLANMHLSLKHTYCAHVGEHYVIFKMVICPGREYIGTDCKFKITIVDLTSRMVVWCCFDVSYNVHTNGA